MNMVRLGGVKHPYLYHVRLLGLIAVGAMGGEWDGDVLGGMDPSNVAGWYMDMEGKYTGG